MTERHLLDFRAGAPWSERALEVHRRAAAVAWADAAHPSSEGRRAATWLDAARATMRDLTGFPFVTFLPNRRAAVTAALDALDAHRVCVPATHRQDVLARADVVVPVTPDGAARWDEAAPPDADSVFLLQHGNEETGVGDSPVPGARCILDASQTLGRLPLPDDIDIVCADLRAAGSPVDVGVVLARRDLGIDDLAQVPAVVVGVDALTAVWGTMDAAGARTEEAMADFEATVRGRVPDVQFHGAHRAAHLRSLSVLHLDAETLMRALDARGWVVGSGSACVRDGQPSHVLAAMGRITHGNLRLALPVGLDPTVLTDFADDLAAAVTRLRVEAGVDDL